MGFLDKIRGKTDETSFKYLDQLIHSNEKIVFAAIPLLFEVSWQNRFDKIIFVSANEEIRLNRLMKRNNLTKQEAKSRINSQQKEEEKIKQSDFVIYNNSTINDLHKSVLNILKQIDI